MPAIALPKGLDQFDNAVRLEHLGAGRWFKPSAQSGTAVVDTREDLLADPAVRAAVSSWQREKSAEQGQGIAGIMKSAFGA